MTLGRSALSIFCSYGASHKTSMTMHYDSQQLFPGNEGVEVSHALPAVVQGYLAHTQQPHPPGPPQGPRDARTVGSYRGVISYEQGI